MVVRKWISKIAHAITCCWFNCHPISVISATEVTLSLLIGLHCAAQIHTHTHTHTHMLRTGECEQTAEPSPNCACICGEVLARESVQQRTYASTRPRLRELGLCWVRHSLDSGGIGCFGLLGIGLVAGTSNYFLCEGTKSFVGLHIISWLPAHHRLLCHNGLLVRHVGSTHN